MAENFDYDLVVIGSGPGGYVAGIRAAQLGMKVACVEKDKPGGVCLNIGCIPSKALIHQAELFRGAAGLEAMGVTVDRGTLDYSKVYQASRQAADTLSKGVEFLFKKNKIDLIPGFGRLAGPHAVDVQGGKRLSARNILIATGSRPRTIPGFEIDEQTVLSSTGILMMQNLPKSMLILGSGAIGMEFAHVMNAFGVQVHVVEMLDRILPLEDDEIVAVLARSFRKRGVQFSTGARAMAMTRTDSGIQVTLESQAGQQTVEAERVLVAVGRAPNSEDIGLDKLGIATEKGFIVVGDYYQTAVRGIYAIGDVVNTPLLAHVASKEGEMAVLHMAGREQREALIDLGAIPNAIYCEPQIASFGLNERQAKEAGRAYKKATFPYRAAGKAVAEQRPEGLAKVLYNPDTHEILGVHIVGAEATDIIHELLLAKSSELLPADVAEMIHAHPTISEVNMELMRSAEGWAIHV